MGVAPGAGSLEKRNKVLIDARFEGSHVQGIIANYVIIENFYSVDTGLPTAPSQGRLSREIPPCPYPGLANFGPRDHAIFFGRTTAVERLRLAVSRQSLTAVVGASGSGKSSVVLAGLAPELGQRGDWRFTHFRIGNEQDFDPFMALSRALFPLLEERISADNLVQLQELAQDLESGDLKLANLLSACSAANSGKRILVIADQFEEIFTFVSDAGRRQRYIDVLLGGFPHDTGGYPPNISLVLTFRADFYASAVLERQLADALQGRVENLGPMTREELKEAIEKPAGVVVYESGLVARLLDDVEKRPGSLPLLQFALVEMWKRQQDGHILHRSYDEIGGVRGALAQCAQSIFDSFTDGGRNGDQVRKFRRLLTRMVTFGEGALDARRVIDRTEVDPDDWALAQRLATENNRLVTTNATETGRETAEFVHEALIDNWPRLAGWIGDDRHFQSWLRQLRPGIEAWKVAPDDKTRLLSGYGLATAEEWISKRDLDLSTEERTYVRKSIEWDDAEHKRTRRMKRLVLAASLAAVCAIVWEWWSATRATRDAKYDYGLAVDSARSISKLVDEHLLPNGKKLPESLLAESLLEVPLSTFRIVRTQGETSEGAMSRLQLFEALWNSFYVLGDWNRASSAANTELEIAETQWKNDNNATTSLDWLRYMARAHENKGADARGIGDLNAADAEYEAAERSADQLQEARLKVARETSVDAAKVPWESEVAHAHEYRGDVLRDEGKFADALREFRVFFGIVGNRDSNDDRLQREICVVHGKVADMLLQQSNVAGAEREFRLDLDLSQRLLERAPNVGDFSRGVAVSYERLGFVLRSERRWPEALHDYEEDLRITSELVRRDSANTLWRRDLAIANEGLGDVSRETGDMPEAMKYFGQYHEIMTILVAQPKSSSRFKRDLGIADQRLADTLLNSHRNEEALAHFRDCISDSTGASTAFDPRNPEPKDVGAYCRQQAQKLMPSKLIASGER